MPRNRNRGVVNNFEFPPEFLTTLPSPDKVGIAQKSSPNHSCFGEPISEVYNKCKGDKIYNISSSSNVSDIDILSFGKSSASSISWSDDFDVEGTQRVKNELERLERILQGKEKIPAHYNRDEYEQWMKTFPQLSEIKITEDIANQHRQQSNYLCNVAYPENCDKVSTSTKPKKANSIKFSVIGDAFQDVSLKIPNDKSGKRRDSRHTQINHNRLQNLTTQFDSSILRISPVLLQEPVHRSFYLNTRQQSSHSVYKSDRLASKWMQEEPQDYTSLPYLTMEAAKNKPRKISNIKAPNSSKLSYSSKTSPKKYLCSLPPIKTITIPSCVQYRSISATPRKLCSESSAVSAHIDFLKRRRKVTQNKLESIYNILNYSK